MTSIPAHYSAGYLASESRGVPGWGRISWGPIMMGAVCAIGLQFIFTVLGIALGASAGQVADGGDATSVRTVGMAAGLWWLITGTIALAAGGFVFGRLSGLPQSLALKLEAAAMWGVVALFGFLVIWSGTGMLSEAASPIGAMSASSRDPSAQERSSSRSMNGSNLSASNVRATDTAIASSPSAEDARRATRTASWWSVIGLVAGLGASVAGACGGASLGLRGREVTPRDPDISS